MFRCQKCKKWLKNITTETDIVYDGTIYHATNVPAKICPECGKITIYEIIQERIVQYATQRNVKILIMQNVKMKKLLPLNQYCEFQF